MPTNYVEKQQQFNTFHLDGNKVAFAEESTNVAAYFCKIVASGEGPKTSFLDLGCRMGYCLDTFAGAFPEARIVGADIVPEFVAEANEIGEAVVADAHHLPFGDEEFDWVFCAQTLEHCYNPAQAAAEIARVAKCGFLVGIPLEGREAYEANESHYAFSDNPITWLRLFEPMHDWRLFHVIGSNSNRYMNFIFLRVVEAVE